MHFIVMSGRSGSGKSSALRMLEDIGYTCIDNLPVSLLPALITQMMNSSNTTEAKFAIGIDARNLGGDLSRLPDIIKATELDSDHCEIVYLDANDNELSKRFSETRRKHPLSSTTIGLQEAIQTEKTILEPVANIANIIIDTSKLTLHELRSTIKKRVAFTQSDVLALSFESFGFKFGVPSDADFVFDVRCLPNPHWIPELRAQTGLEQDVIDFLDAQSPVTEMFTDICNYLHKWVPYFEANNRCYLTVAVGCTGGMHRSVYLVERLGTFFKALYPNVQIRHRQQHANKIL